MKNMPKSLLLSLLAGALLTEAKADNWLTVDAFQLVPGLSAIAADIGTAADGTTLYSVGSSTTNSGYLAGVIRKSTDSGATWSTVDVYQEPGWPQATYRGFGSGTNGTLFVCGEVGDGVPDTGTKIWTVRQSVDGGATWALVDAFYQGPTGKPSCGDVKMNPYTGDVFAVGVGNTGSSAGFLWAVRKRAANAAAFDTVDMVGAPPQNTARAVGFHRTAGVFVVGQIGDSEGRYRWTVRRSADRGVTWTTVDSFIDSAKTSSHALGIAVDATSGAIYVSGQAGQVVKGKMVTNWVVRRSRDGGATWTTVDRFGAEPTPTYYGLGVGRAAGITLAPSGNVFVTGNSSAPQRLLVRKGTTAPNGAMSWVMSDDFQLVPGQASSGLGIASDALGNIFVSGQGQIDSTGLGYFLTTKLAGPQ